MEKCFSLELLITRGNPNKFRQRAQFNAKCNRFDEIIERNPGSAPLSLYFTQSWQWFIRKYVALTSVHVQQQRISGQKEVLSTHKKKRSTKSFKRNCVMKYCRSTAIVSIVSSYMLSMALLSFTVKSYT